VAISMGCIAVSMAGIGIGIIAPYREGDGAVINRRGGIGIGTLCRGGTVTLCRGGTVTLRTGGIILCTDSAVMLRACAHMWDFYRQNVTRVNIHMRTAAAAAVVGTGAIHLFILGSSIHIRACAVRRVVTLSTAAAAAAAGVHASLTVMHLHITAIIIIIIIAIIIANISVCAVRDVIGVQRRWCA
jgi:hypothetical protein